MNTVKTTELITCPCCKQGKIKAPAADKKKLRQKQDFVKILVGNGYSYREVMKILGYKSPRSISYILKK